VTALTYLTTHFFSNGLGSLQAAGDSGTRRGCGNGGVDRDDQDEAFALSAFFPGVLAASTLTWSLHSPDSVLKADVTDFMVVMAFLGGIGSLWGPFSERWWFSSLAAPVVVLGEGTFYLVIIGQPSVRRALHS